jgi:hypothetical protein
MIFTSLRDNLSESNIDSGIVSSLRFFDPVLPEILRCSLHDQQTPVFKE